jgi:hypothetical protein
LCVDRKQKTTLATLCERDTVIMALSSKKEDKDGPAIITDIALQSEVWCSGPENAFSWEIGHLIEKRTPKNQPPEWIVRVPGAKEVHVNQTYYALGSYDS